jgi:hypothetical protein
MSGGINEFAIKVTGSGDASPLTGGRDLGEGGPYYQDCAKDEYYFFTHVSVCLF